ncbi:eukaryotic mitochondrial regulator protein-domain-containing protein [Triangularia verruculosa]|uniref:Eukaryotic mitochondrial regulator protein-domain-containing protein n=1 Tax=Triangularia verruculosa TaxID=2587418 RepID=A0AAN7AT32_9PEZI|nr:eukaryotic mitochondrial regulator protein-domain-containing protein [Triangularia verruculosa]
MPPRIRSSNCPPQQLLLNYLDAPLPSSLLPLHRPLALAASSNPSPSSPSCRLQPQNPQCQQQASSFSTSQPREMTKPQREFRSFLKRMGKQFETHEGNGPRYLGRLQRMDNTPFPSNKSFKSEPVLSSRARRLIWEAVMLRGMPLKAVSAQYQVDIRRVAAVVRLMEIEKRMEKENAPMAIPYARAVEKMLPRANLESSEEPFEPINDVHVHSFTMQQLFVPVSESREFTRKDAAKAFGDHILPPDHKMRIPELVEMEKDILNGVPQMQAEKQFLERTAESERRFAESQKYVAAKKDAKKSKVDTERFEFRIENFNSEAVGKKGRARNAVGWRYGVPFNDRQKGLYKIPTSVG